jgi:hypothetical protein
LARDTVLPPEMAEAAIRRWLIQLDMLDILRIRAGRGLQ